MPRVTEEIVLPILDAADGAIPPSLPEHRRDAAAAGAALMDLALENRVDTDRERLFLVDSKPVGDDLLDPVLLDIAGEAETRDAAFWLPRATERGAAIREKAIRRLVERGVPEAEANGLVFPSRSVARARREADAASAGGPLTGDSIAGMVDTRHAVMETPRMRPVASASRDPGNDRRGQA